VVALDVAVTALVPVARDVSNEEVVFLLVPVAADVAVMTDVINVDVVMTEVLNEEVVMTDVLNEEVVFLLC